MERRTAHMAHTLGFGVSGQFAGDVAGPIVRQQARLDSLQSQLTSVTANAQPATAVASAPAPATSTSGAATVTTANGNTIGTVSSTAIVTAPETATPAATTAVAAAAPATSAAAKTQTASSADTLVNNRALDTSGIGMAALFATPANPSALHVAVVVAPQAAEVGTGNSATGTRSSGARPIAVSPQRLR